MMDIGRVGEPDQLKTLADEHRMQILRRLLGGEATLTQLGAALGRHPAWVRHHLKQLERVGLVRLARTVKVGGYVEKYYTACAAALQVQMLLTPLGSRDDTIVAMGSDDPALELLASILGEQPKGPRLLTLSVGSLDGLVALRQGQADIAGCHLFDPGAGEFNLPFVRHLFPDQDVVVMTFAEREQGLIVRDHDPKAPAGVEDLTSPDVTLVNRKRGSGTRLWLDQRLRQLGIPHEAVRGYESQAPGHVAAAQAVAERAADAAIGISAAADLFGLRFIPLFHERYDLVLRKSRADDPLVEAVLEGIAGRSFHQAVGRLSGYDMARSGDVSVVVA
jgi:putative molybdopterin biosynthesis protein